MDPLVFIIFFQILIESFPVSSSGHVLLLEKLFAKFGCTTNLQLPDFFDHFLHGPTIIVIMILFYKDWSIPVFNLLKGLFNKSYRTKDSYKRLVNIFCRLCLYLFITSSITSLFWVVQKMPWGSRPGLLQAGPPCGQLILGFSITMVLLLSLLFVGNTGRKSLRIWLILGLAQGLALILPGLSRFASVYVVSRWLGINPRRAFQITFLLEIPLIVPAFILGAIKMVGMPGWQNLFSFQVCLSFIVSTIFSFFALLFMQKLAINKRLSLIGFYMLIPIIIAFFC